MDYSRVTVIILNWNGWNDTIECLESVYKIIYPNFSVLVVDNASEDDSLEKIRKYCSGELEIESDFFDYNQENKPIHLLEYDISIDKEKDFKFPASSPGQLILIKNNENSHFPAGNNIGIRFTLKHLKTDYILLLNNDTVVNKYFLKELVEAGESREDVGILGPKIYYYDETDVIWSAGCKISWKFGRGLQIGTGEKDQGQYNTSKEVELISGSAFLIKTEVLNKIGLMDKKYFLYFEESDWTLKANQAGYKSFYIPTAKVWHKVSRSGGGISNPIGLYYITRNRWIFMRRWARKSDYAVFVVYQVLGAIILPIFLSLSYGNLKLFKAYYKGLKDGVK